ncbi:MAG TPA: J domain-containing protein [Bryobacteraceae bacterium]|nr:J domain-containing protein [Bryobacteraceae bacterium]
MTWRGRDGITCSADAQGLDISSTGVGLECVREIPVDAVVQLKATDSSVVGEGFVAHCTRRGMRYHIGLEFTGQTRHHNGANAPASHRSTESDTDYYDVLQISPKADMETVHRVFRIMATRFHPDNPETGDPEEFLSLKKAYDVLSDPGRRAEYDAVREARQSSPLPIFELKDFVTGVEAESNRRLGVLSLLYNQRRMDPDNPGVSLLELEKRMGFPREYLSFTMWYLRSKEYILTADNSDYALTARGVDHVESNAAQSEILCKLLKPPGSRPSQPNTKQAAKPENINRQASRYLPEASAH